MSRARRPRGVLVVAAGLGLAAAWVVSAAAADLHGITGYDEYAENHEGIARALEKRPSLARDPSYLEHHPSLKQYLHDNPLARAEFDAEDDAPPPAVAKAAQEERSARKAHAAHPDGSHRFVVTEGSGDDD